MTATPGAMDACSEGGRKFRLVGDLTRWWLDKAEDEIAKTVEKAVEYGSNSMIDVGHQIARTAGRTVTDEEAAELACYFYLVGKMGRWADAIVAGDRVSDDTLFDIGVYARMTQRIRSNGGWPGATLSEIAEVKIPEGEVAKPIFGASIRECCDTLDMRAVPHLTNCEDRKEGWD